MGKDWWSELISGMSFPFSLTSDLHLGIEPPFQSGIHNGVLELKETLDILISFVFYIYTRA